VLDTGADFFVWAFEAPEALGAVAVVVVVASLVAAGFTVTRE